MTGTVVAKFILSPCQIHHDCTQKSTFASEGFDPGVDVKAISEHLQGVAVANFGPVSCIGVEHIPGMIDIRREE